MFGNVRKFFSKLRTIKKIDDVSSMERVGRDEYRYIEGDHALTLQIDMLSGSPRRVIYSRSIKGWLPPHDSEAISDEKRNQIIQKVCKYFELNHMSYDVR